MSQTTSLSPFGVNVADAPPTIFTSEAATDVVLASSGAAFAACTPSPTDPATSNAASEPTTMRIR